MPEPTTPDLADMIGKGARLPGLDSLLGHLSAELEFEQELGEAFLVALKHTGPGSAEHVGNLISCAVEAAGGMLVRPGAAAGYIAGYRDPAGAWWVSVDGPVHVDRDNAIADMRKASVDVPGVDWRALTVIDGSGQPYSAAAEQQEADRA
jgi:hypothetical protein